MRFTVLLSAAALVAFSFAAEAGMADASASKEDCMAAIAVDTTDDFTIAVLQDRCVGHATCNAQFAADASQLSSCQSDVERKAQTALQGRDMNKENTMGKVAVATDADNSDTAKFVEGDGKGYGEGNEGRAN